MALQVQVTTVYQCFAQGCTASALQTAMAAANIPVDSDFLTLWGLSVISDNTTLGGLGTAMVTRTIVLSLNQPPFVSAFNSNALQAVAYNPSPTIRSKSANDTLGGSGARTVTINYLDTGSVARTENVNLNGTTRVQLANANYAQINAGFLQSLPLGIVINTFGADGANDGDLVIEQLQNVPPNFQGGPVGGPNPARQVLGYAPASYYSKMIPGFANAVGTQQSIGNWMQAKLEGTLGLPVVPVFPVVFA